MVSKGWRWRAKVSFYPHPAPLLVGSGHGKQALTAASSSPAIRSLVDVRSQKRALNTRKFGGGSHERRHPRRADFVEIDRLGVMA